MAVLGNVLGFGAFGIAARAWQLGIQKRNLFQCRLLVIRTPAYISLTDRLHVAPGAYLLSGGAFGAIGYWLVGVEERQVELIAQKRKTTVQLRNRKLPET
ncbi:hypothetical protein RhiTH_006090 [Rhizoctonia solani]